MPQVRTKTNVMETAFVENVKNVTPTTQDRKARKLSDEQNVVDTIWCMKNLRKMEKRKRDLVCKIYEKRIFPTDTKIVDTTNRDKTYSQAVPSKTNTTPTSKYQNLVRKLLELGPGDYPNFIKNLRAELKKR